MREEGTITSWALLIWQTLLERGYSPHKVFQEAGADPVKLKGTERYHLGTMQKLWEAAEKETGDPTFGLDVGLNWKPTTFNALGFSWLASNSLKDAFSRMERFARVLNPSLMVEVSRAGANYQVRIGSQQAGNFHTSGLYASNTSLLVMCRILCGPSFCPLEVHLPRERTASTTRLEDLLGLSVATEAEYYHWIISHFDMEKSLATGNAELARINDNASLKMLNQIDKESITSNIRECIIKTLPSGQLKEADIANNLHMTTRTMQRKLKEENITYSAMLEEIRKELALSYMADKTHSLTEISYLLGFSEQANFSRAFKRWFNQSPTQYRTNELGQVA